MPLQNETRTDLLFEQWEKPSSDDIFDFPQECIDYSTQLLDFSSLDFLSSFSIVTLITFYALGFHVWGSQFKSSFDRIITLVVQEARLHRFNIPCLNELVYLAFHTYHISTIFDFYRGFPATIDHYGLIRERVFNMYLSFIPNRSETFFGNPDMLEHSFVLYIYILESMKDIPEVKQLVLRQAYFYIDIVTLLAS
jgi:hypothetical protein